MAVREAIDQVIVDVQRYTEAGQALIDRVEMQNAWNTEDIASLRGGVTMTESMEAAASAERSREMTRVLGEFEAARRAVRKSVAAAMLEEGTTLTQLGDAFGVTRQLAGRFAKDAATEA